MKTLIPLALAAALLAGQAQAACTYPKAPAKIPDGSTSTLEQMLAGQKEVKSFDAAITAYQACLETQFNTTVAAQPDMTPEARAELEKIRDQKMNAAVDEAQSVADQLNAQIRVWKEKNAKK
jgi:hypothetical protein